MAIINQVPANQTSVAISGINIVSLGSTGNPTRQGQTAYFAAAGNSIAITLVTSGSGGGTPSTPTIGQIYPQGYR